MKLRKPKYRWALLIILSIAAVAWFPIFKNYFHHDDWSIFQTILNFRNGNFSINSFFLNEHFSPILFFAKYIQTYLFRLNFNWYLIIQLFLYLTSGLIIASFLKIIFDEKFALVLTFLFLLNPAYFEIVGWGATEGFLLAFIFTIFGLISMNKFIASHKTRHLTYVIVSIFISCLSSGVGYLSLVFIFLFYIFIKKQYKNIKKEFNVEIRWASVLLLVALIMGIPYIYSTIYSHKFLMSGGNMNFNPYALIRFSLLGFFLGNFLPMFGLYFLDRESMGRSLYPNNILFLLVFLVSLFLLVIYFIINLRRDVKFKEILTGEKFRFLCFSVSTIIASYVFVAIPRTWVGIESFIFFGRYHLFASLGLLIIIGIILEKLNNIIKKNIFKIAIVTIAFISLFLLQFKNISQVIYFRDNKNKIFASAYLQLRKQLLSIPSITYCLEDKGSMQLLEGIITFGKPKISYRRECKDSLLQKRPEIQTFYQQYFLK